MITNVTLLTPADLGREWNLTPIPQVRLHMFPGLPLEPDAVYSSEHSSASIRTSRWILYIDPGPRLVKLLKAGDTRFLPGAVLWLADLGLFLEGNLNARQCFSYPNVPNPNRANRETED